MSQSDDISAPDSDTDAAADDWQALSDAIGLLVERITEPVEGMHNAIAARWFGLAGPMAEPAGRAYSTITAGIYQSVRIAGYAVGSAVRLAAVARAAGSQPGHLWKSPASAKLQATANALWGDEFARRHSPMSIEMSLRDASGERIPIDERGLEQAFPQASPRIVVMIHGLAETERSWRRTADDDDAGFAGVLAEASYTPVLVRYNSGRRVSENGSGLAALLEEVVDVWPVPVEEIALVGNSMGGLVARSATHAGHDAGHRWTDAVRHVVAIASPHLGAPLEKGVNLVAKGLSRAPESRPLGTFLDRRSAGIKDLRFGAILETDWPPEALAGSADDRGFEVSAPAGVHQHFVAGVVTADPAHPIGVLVGDLMVRVGSSTGRGARRTVEAANVHVLGNRRHFDLLHDADVHHQVVEWLTAPDGDEQRRTEPGSNP